MQNDITPAAPPTPAPQPVAAAPQQSAQTAVDVVAAPKQNQSVAVEPASAKTPESKAAEAKIATTTKQKAAPKQPSNTPIVAIVFAFMVFVALSAVAVLAFKKGA